MKTFENLLPKLVIAPGFVLGFGFIYGFMIWNGVLSVTGSRMLPNYDEFVGLEQYIRLWDMDRWYVALKNLGIFSTLYVGGSMALGMVLAIFLDQKVRAEGFLRTVYLYPMALSFIVTGTAWKWILNPQFGIQGVVRDMGWTSFSFDPLNNPDTVLFGLLIAGLWQGTGFVMCLMLAGLRGIDEDIWKAARVDGIPTWKTYVVVIIPMMRAVFITTLVIVASGIIRLYDLVVAMTSGGPGGNASQVPAMYVYDYMFQAQNLGQGFAASTMMLLSVLIVLIPWAYLEFGGKKHG